jgi:hypothetical protein
VEGWRDEGVRREGERGGKRGNTQQSWQEYRKKCRRRRAEVKKGKSSERGFESQRVFSTAARQKGNFRERELEKPLKDLKDCEESKAEGEQQTRY